MGFPGEEEARRVASKPYCEALTARRALERGEGAARAGAARVRLTAREEAPGSERGELSRATSGALEPSRRAPEQQRAPRPRARAPGAFQYVARREKKKSRSDTPRSVPTERRVPPYSRGAHTIILLLSKNSLLRALRRGFVE